MKYGHEEFMTLCIFYVLFNSTNLKVFNDLTQNIIEVRVENPSQQCLDSKLIMTISN